MGEGLYERVARKRGSAGGSPRSQRGKPRRPNPSLRQFPQKSWEYPFLNEIGLDRDKRIWYQFTNR